MTKTLIWSVALIVSALILGIGNIEAPPATKVTEVTGTVDVGNFPDAVRFVGYTSQAILSPATGDVMALNRECALDYETARACRVNETFLMIPPISPFELSWHMALFSDEPNAGRVYCLNPTSGLGTCSTSTLV